MNDYTQPEKKLFYIKLYHNLIKGKELSKLRYLPDGYKIFGIYILLLDYARGSKDGILATTINGTKYNDSIEELCSYCENISVAEMHTAIKALVNVGLITINVDGAYVINNYKDIGSGESYSAVKMRRIREQKKEPSTSNSNSTSHNVTDTVTDETTNNITS